MAITVCESLVLQTTWTGEGSLAGLGGGEQIVTDGFAVFIVQLGGAEVTVTVAVPKCPEPSVAVPVTVQLPAVEGAVYRPEELMVPQLADQVTATLALNCWVAPVWTDAELGEMTTGDCTVTVACP